MARLNCYFTIRFKTKLILMKPTMPMKIKMTSPPCRPLKCKFCCRRFKYEACMNDHIRGDHYPILLRWLQQQSAKGNLLKKKQCHTGTVTMEPKSVRVSVIKRNVLLKRK